MLRRASLSALALLCGCRGEFSGYCGAGPDGPARLVVRFDEVRQAIEGFGASNAFMGEALTDAQADLFFSPEKGIGLSLLRLRIAESGELGGGGWTDAVRAAERGARVWATPWSAPGEWKDNGDADHGGHLCARAGQGRCTAAHYRDWADRLAAFAGALEQGAGVPLYALSVQNEPDMSEDYPSLNMNPGEFAEFAKVLGPTLARLGNRPKLVVGEYGSWGHLPSLIARVSADPGALAEIDVFAAHEYDGVAAVGAAPRPVWQTEFSRFQDSFDPSVRMGVVAAHAVHQALLEGGASTWHYWWLVNPVADDNQGLVGHAGDPAALTKRLYAVGNFARFVRPGWRRVEVDGGAGGLVASAYRDPGSGAFAVVVENCSTTGDVAVEVDVSGAGVEGVEPWVTAGTPVDALGTDGNLSRGSAGAGLSPWIPVRDGVFRAAVPYGVTTFVGRPAGPPP